METPDQILRKAAMELSRLKKIKTLIETGYATKADADDYYANREKAWIALDEALSNLK